MDASEAKLSTLARVLGCTAEQMGNDPESQDTVSALQRVRYGDDIIYAVIDHVHRRPRS